MIKRTCSIQDCERPVYGRGWCNMHWQRWRKYRDALYVPPRHKGRICSIEGCALPHRTRGLCSVHYYRWKRLGDPEAIVRRRGVPWIGVKGYLYIYEPTHPMANGSGQVLVHRKVAYDAGMLMDRSLIVHHRDGDKTNNDLLNLEVMSKEQHDQLHADGRKVV